MSDSPTLPPSVAGLLGPNTKVFGVGLNKTGTSSLKRCWEVLGIGPIPNQKDISRSGITNAVLLDGKYETALAFAEKYRGLEDRPWNVGRMYRALHERFSDSLFILTVRDEQSWWRSVHHWITEVKPQVQNRYLVHFGVDSISQEGFIAAYRRYNSEVAEYFAANDPSRFLRLAVGEGGEWEKVCGFFGMPVPPGKFPHANKQRYQAAGKRKILRPDDRDLRLKRCSKCDMQLAKQPNVNPDGDASISLGMKQRVAAWREEVHVRKLIRREARYGEQGRYRERARVNHPGMTLDGFGVVTCYFNPLGSKRRQINYHKFADGMKRANIPLLTVELALSDHPHHLQNNWGDILRVRSESLMWHKERLLNLGIKLMIEQGYEKIAWLDADIEFLSKDWAWQIAAELETFNVCQAFARVLVQREAKTLPHRGVGSVKYFSDRGRLYPQWRKVYKQPLRLGYPSGHSGFGWAARADLLRRVPLYDSAVIGGGDRLICLASFGHDARSNDAVERWFRSSNPECPRCGHRDVAGRWHEHYIDWAKSWNDATQGKVGYADTLIQDFYHGSRESRQYQYRSEILLRERFDPVDDLRVNSDGCMEWDSDKPQLHEDLRHYFSQRRDQ